MKQVETIFQGKWLDVRKAVWSEIDAEGFEYAHFKTSYGMGVAVLPYANTPEDQLVYLVRREFNPAWINNLDLPTVAAVTGRVEPEGPAVTALLELEEEAGFKVNSKDLTFLGKCKTSKASDTTMWLYAVDVTDIIQYEATGDGSKHEAHEWTEWMSKDEIIAKADDPLLHVLLNKLEYENIA